MAKTSVLGVVLIFWKLPESFTCLMWWCSKTFRYIILTLNYTLLYTICPTTTGYEPFIALRIFFFLIPIVLGDVLKSRKEVVECAWDW